MSGVAPEVVEVPEGHETEPTDQKPPEDPDIAEVDLTEDDLADDGLFSGAEDAARTDSDDDPNDGADPREFGDPLGVDQDVPTGQLAVAINDGAARLAVVGLDDAEAEKLEEEFVEVFEAFRLGYFGAECADRYILVEDEEVHPAWGLLGTAFCCAAFALYMRPDGEEKFGELQEAVGTLATGFQQGAAA